jgi:hypothetical protein
MITVTIGGPRKNPEDVTFSRELVIENIDMVPENRDYDHTSTYAVELKVVDPRNGNKGHRDTAVFKHRYGDDLLSLVQEAIIALGGIRGVDSDLPKR